MKYYRIKDWNTVYENNRTRELKKMDWIPVPNKHDGDGYTTLVGRENGAEFLGAWLAILQIASKCEVRGTLLRDGATPHTPHSLARMSHLPAGCFEKAFPVLLNECKWLDLIDDSANPAGGCGIPAGRCGEVTIEEKGREGNEEKGREGSPAVFSEHPSWVEFWTYCQSQACLLPAEWYAKDKWEAANADNWRKAPNWQAYARRCKGWWEADGRPATPNKSNATNRNTAPSRNAGTYNETTNANALKSKIR